MGSETTVAKKSQFSEGAPIYNPNFKWEYLYPKYWASWMFVALLAACSFAPRWVVKWLGVGVGKLYFCLNAKRRAIATRNIELCFPEKSLAERKQLLIGHYRVYGRSIVDLGLAIFASDRKLLKLIKINGLQEFQQHLQNDRPVILLTPHLAAMDYGLIMLSRYHPACTMMKELPNPLINWLVCRGRTRYGLTLSLREQGMRPIVRALQANKMCYYLPDEDFGSKRSVFVPYFGIQTATITVLGRLAALTNAVVVPCFTKLRADHKGYEIHLGKALEEFPSGDRVNDAITMNTTLEAGIRNAPEQYFWTFKWFRSRPEGERTLYD